MKKIGILSVAYHNWNYGGMLQGCALSAALQNSDQVLLQHTA